MTLPSLKFVGTDAEGLPLKRKQSQRACEACRKRKKRCIHQGGGDRRGMKVPTSVRMPDESHNDSPAADALVSNRDRAQNAHSIPPVSATSTVVANNDAPFQETDEEDRDPRFIGELNPEATFVVGSSSPPTIAAPVATSPMDLIGKWVPRIRPGASQWSSEPVIPGLADYLEAECVRMLPQSDHYKKLCQVYLDDFHPILPMIDPDSLNNQSNATNNFVKLAVCLAVVSSQKANSLLQSAPGKFITNGARLIRSAIDNELVTDKRLVVQLLMVLSLCTQLSNDRHQSAEFAYRAISYVYTGGLHLDTSSHGDDESLTRLFCCSFVLDRLSAAIHGRAVIMHERDIGRNLDLSIGQQHGVFQLLLRITLLLDKVIALYRPVRTNSNESGQNSATIEEDFPSFEDLLNACGNIKAPVALVATVETLYHAVAMLSCRSQSLDEISRSSASHVRQRLSATNITNIAGNEFRDQLTAFPFVPYSISLALRVSYRELRLSKTSFTRARARRQLLHVCGLLKGMGETFTSSQYMAELAERTIHQMDRTYTSMAAEQRREVVPLPGHVQHPSDQIDSIPLQRSHHHHPNVNDNLPKSSEGFGDTVVDVTGDHEEEHRHLLPNLAYQHTLHSDEYDVQAFDLTQFDFDLDIFDHLGPDFNIGAIDQVLANSIEPRVTAPVTESSEIFL